MLTARAISGPIDKIFNICRFFLRNKRVNGAKTASEWLEVRPNYIFSDIKTIICFVFIADVFTSNVIISF